MSNISECELYLRIFNPDATEHYFRAIKDKDSNDRSNPRLKVKPDTISLVGTLHQHYEELQQLNADGYNIFVRSNVGNGFKKEDIQSINLIYVDIDADKGCLLANTQVLCEQHNFPPHAVVETSPGNYHLLWRTEGVQLNEYDDILNKLIAAYGSDESTKGRQRLLRLAGFHNNKVVVRNANGGPWLVRVADKPATDQGMPAYPAARLRTIISAMAGQPACADPFPALPGCDGKPHAQLGSVQPEALQAAVAMPEAAQQGSGNLLQSFNPQAELRRGLQQTDAELLDALRFIDPGSSDNWRNIVKPALKHYGSIITDSVAWQIFDRWSKGELWQSGQPFNYDFANNWREWCQSSANGGGNAPIFRLAADNGWINPASNSANPQGNSVVRQQGSREFFELVANLENVDNSWLVDTLLPTNAYTAIVGASGSGKTFVALNIACAVAANVPFLGMQTNKLASPTKKNTVFYLCGEGRGGIKKRLDAWSAYSGIPLDGLPVFVSSYLPAITNEADVQFIINKTQELANQYGAPALIIIDTLAQGFGNENENDAGGMKKFSDGVKTMLSTFEGCTVLVVHHMGHNSDRARGSSAFKAGLDTEITLNNDGNLLKVTKQKDADRLPDIPIKLQKQSFSNDTSSSCVVVKGDSSAADAIPKEGDNYTKEFHMENIIVLKFGPDKGRDFLAKRGFPMSRSAYFSLQSKVKAKLTDEKAIDLSENATERLN